MATFLTDAAWCARFDANFLGSRSTSVDGAAADKLTEILRVRLKVHINASVADVKKRQHWVWQFVQDNLATVSAMIVRANHVCADLGGRGHGDSLLVQVAGRFHEVTVQQAQQAQHMQAAAAAGMAGRAGRNRQRVQSARAQAGAGAAGGGGAGTGQQQQQQGVRPAVLECTGSYLVFDRIRSLHVRSGKVCPRPFHSRIAEHKSGAASANLAMNASRFYRSYPTKAAAAGLGGIRKGFFEDLKFQVALGFDPARSTVVNNFFVWKPDIIPNVTKVNFSNTGCTTLPKKKLQCVAYLLELVYGLMLSPTADVSTNPGFETCLGIYG